MSQEINLTVSTEGLTALSEMAIATKDQSKLDDLLARNAEAQLSIEEQQELDRLLRRIDDLNLVKARAAFALRQLLSKELN